MSFLTIVYECRNGSIFSSQVTIRSYEFPECIMKLTSKLRNLRLLLSSRALYLSIFLSCQFYLNVPIYLKCYHTLSEGIILHFDMGYFRFSFWCRILIADTQLPKPCCPSPVSLLWNFRYQRRTHRLQVDDSHHAHRWLAAV